MRINNTHWNLIFCNPYDPILYTGNGNYTLGITVPEENAIYIANDLYGDLLHHVLTHELWHAEMVSRNIYVPLYIEEALCDVVADHGLEAIKIAENVHSNLCRYYGRC